MSLRFPTRPRWAIAAAALPLVLLLAGWAAWKHEPRFYRQALSVNPVEQQQRSQEFLEQVGALTGSLQRQGEWQSLVTDAQINGWLAADFAQNFAQFLPPGFRDPRVRINQHHVELVCRYGDGWQATALRLEFDLYLDEPDELGIRLRHARAGRLPLPLGSVLAHLSLLAQHNQWHLRWLQSGGDPVAILRVPWNRQTRDQRTLERLVLRRGEVFVAGRVHAALPLAERNALPETARTSTPQAESQENVQR